MKELVCRRTVELAFFILGIAGPVFGVVVGTILGMRSRRAILGAAVGFIIGGIGTLVYGMWHAYNAITNAIGFDSVINLVLQLLMFALLGAVIGTVAIRISARIGRPRSG